MFTRSDTDELLAKFNAAQRVVDEITYSGVYPVYPEEIPAFMKYLATPPWNKRDYDPQVVKGLLERIESVGGDDLKRILTCFQRAERFADGAWGAILGGDALPKVIRRIVELSEPAVDHGAG